MHCPGRCLWSCSLFFSTVIPPMKHSTGHITLSLPYRASRAWELSWKKTPSTNAGSVKRSHKCSKASASNKHMNYSNCQELWLHDITSSSLVLLKSKHGYAMCRWAVPHSLLCPKICVSMDAHRLSQSKSFHPTETHELWKQLLLGFYLGKQTEVSDFGLLVSFSMLWNKMSSKLFPTTENINGLSLLVLKRGKRFAHFL